MTLEIYAVVIGAVVFGVVLSPLLVVAMQRSPIRERYLATSAHCMNCGVRIHGAQRFALLSYVARKHTCPKCNKRLFGDTPWFEVSLAVIMGLSAAVTGWAPALPAFLVFVAVAFTISVIDLRHYLIPNRLLYPALYACLVLLSIAAAVGKPQHLVTALIGMAISWLFFFVVWFIYPKGLGFGDVRLAALNGLMAGWLGVQNAVWAIVLGLLAGAIVGGLLVVLRIKGPRDPIPYGPFLALGAYLSIFGSIALS